MADQYGIWMVAELVVMTLVYDRDQEHRVKAHELGERREVRN